MSNSKPDVVMVPKFLTQAEADELLARIRRAAKFRQNRINLYGPKDVPRLEAWYGPWDYPYAKGVILKAAPMPDYLQAVIDRIAAAGFGKFNGVLINYYRDGSHHISPHSDNDYGDPQPTIPSLTLGATRPFRSSRRLLAGFDLDAEIRDSR